MNLSRVFATDRRKTSLLMGLLLVGVVSWFSPLVSATWGAKLSGHRAAAANGPREVVLMMDSQQGELCVQGTTIAGPRRCAVINGSVMENGQQMDCDGASFRIVAIEADRVRLREVTGDERETSAQPKSASLR